MTEPTATAIFNLIKNALAEHDFKGIGTFAMPEQEQPLSSSDYKRDYKYLDSDIEFDNIGVDDRIARRRLRRLLDAALQYFSRGSDAPARFSQILRSVNPDDNSLNFPLTLTLRNERSISLDDFMNSKELHDLKNILTDLRENLDASDETVFAILDKYKT